MKPDFDICVVGAGIVGSAFAAAVADAGLRVIIVDRQDISGSSEGGGSWSRVSALTLASRDLLRRLGAWNEQIEGGAGVFRAMEVWSSKGRGQLSFNSAAVCEPALGYIVADTVTRGALIERLRSRRSVAFALGEEVVGLDVEERGVHVRMRGGDGYTARLVVGADGAASRIRELAALPLRSWPYQQRAIVCSVRTERPHEETARQRFLDGGPLAFLPLGDSRCSIVWSTPSARADELMGLGDEEFARALQSAFESRLGVVNEPSRRMAFALSASHALRYVRPRVALVGDAAHRIHPLAGQGLNLGLLDAAALAEVVLAARARARDIGAFATLRRYERWRKGHNAAMFAAVNVLNGVFRAPTPWMARVLGLGLNLVDRSGPVKQHIIRYALGRQGDLPAMARPLH